MGAERGEQRPPMAKRSYREATPPTEKAKKCITWQELLFHRVFFGGMQLRTNATCYTDDLDCYMFRAAP